MLCFTYVCTYDMQGPFRVVRCLTHSLAYNLRTCNVVVHITVIILVVLKVVYHK